MSATVTAVELRVIDTDTHVTEPPDLWTSRVPAVVATAPHLEPPRHRAPPLAHRGPWLMAAGFYAVAGWNEHPPSTPNELEDVDPGAWRAVDRLADGRVRDLRPGPLPQPHRLRVLALHEARARAVALVCTRAYNDFISDFSAADPSRLVPITMLPVLGHRASVVEMARGQGDGPPRHPVRQQIRDDRACRRSPTRTGIRSTRLHRIWISRSTSTSASLRAWTGRRRA